MLVKKSSELSTTTPSRPPPRSSRSKSATPTPPSRSLSSSRPRPPASSVLPSTSTPLRPGVKAGCRTLAPRSTTPRTPTATSSSSTSATAPLCPSRTSVGPNPPSVMLPVAALLVLCRTPTMPRHRPLKPTSPQARKANWCPVTRPPSMRSRCAHRPPLPTPTVLSNLLRSRSRSKACSLMFKHHRPPTAIH
jgi:hypothetical protein